MQAGKSFLENAQMELAEEIGLEVESEDLFLVDKGYYKPSRHFYESYIYVFERPLAELNFADGEITAVKWLDIPGYWKERKANDEKWCNGLNEGTQKKIEDFMKNL